jgi:YHS domain-containing protein
MGVTKAKAEMIPVAHNGKTYYVCCDDCQKKFAAEPTRWAARAEAVGQSGRK